MRSNLRSTEQRIYLGCLLALPFLILLAVLYHTGHLNPVRLLPPCMFHSVTGFSCPGCGCTRAVAALLRGDFFLSLRNNPVILYCAGLYVVFTASHSAFFLSRIIQKRLPSPQGKGSPFHLLNRIHGMKCTPLYLYILVYIFLGFGILRFLFELWQRIF